MNLLWVVLGSAAILALAYATYGPLLTRLFKLDPTVTTPAVEMRDDVDYAPIEPKFLFSQHFSAIAAAGPIVGPIAAGLLFGWAPALIWILIGSIFIGGVHDFGSLVASIRHKARSIAQIVREHMTYRSYLLFLAFVWIALVYIVVAFTDVVANSFVGQTVEGGTIVTGAGIASSSLLYLVLPILMGVLLRYTKLSLGLATVLFLPLVGVSIWAGQYIPLDLAAGLGLSDLQAAKVWGVLLLLYCFAASLAPMWLLLQPRGHLGGYFLYAALALCAVGLVFGGHTVQYPAYAGWDSSKGPLVPVLFYIIACGACSGFHSIICSGTTSKQLKRETDAKIVGYGSMLLEGLVAVISLSCVMMLTKEQAQPIENKPGLVYANGLGSYMSVLGIQPAFGIAFGLLAFTTFVYDTLDVCTRLGRYVIQELMGWQGRGGRWAATLLTAGVPLVFLLPTLRDTQGKPIQTWQHYWLLFGASNQLLAALTLIGVTVWLHRTYKAWWVWLVAGLPTLFMYVVSSWALLRFVKAGFVSADGSFRMAQDPVPWVALILLALAVLLLVEAIKVFTGFGLPPPRQPEPAPATS